MPEVFDSLVVILHPAVHGVEQVYDIVAVVCQIVELHVDRGGLLFNPVGPLQVVVDQAGVDILVVHDRVVGNHVVQVGGAVTTLYNV